MIITFCGHRSIRAEDNVSAWLEHTLRGLIAQGATTFYLGGYGAFDILANRVLLRLKTEYPKLENILIIPYIDQPRDESAYSSTLYPPLETVPKRLAIARRNEWMIAQSDVVLAYVWQPTGGAAKTLEYARQKKKQVLLFDEALRG